MTTRTIPPLHSSVLFAALATLWWSSSTAQDAAATAPSGSLNDNQAIYDAYYSQVTALQGKHIDKLSEIDRQRDEANSAFREENARRAQTLATDNSAAHKALAEKGLVGSEKQAAVDQIQSEDQRRRIEYAEWRDSTSRKIMEDHRAARNAEMDSYRIEMDRLLSERNASLARLRAQGTSVSPVAAAAVGSSSLSVPDGVLPGTPPPDHDGEVDPSSAPDAAVAEPSLPTRPGVEPALQTPTASIAGQLAITGYETLKLETNACVGEPVTVLGRNLGVSAPAGGIYYGQGDRAGTALPPESYSRWPEIELPGDMPANRRYWLAAVNGETMVRGPESLMVVQCAEFVPPTREVATSDPEWYNLAFTIEVEILKDCDGRGPGEWQWVAQTPTSTIDTDSVRFGARYYSTGGNVKLNDGDRHVLGYTQRYSHVPAGREFKLRLDAVECDRRFGAPTGNLGKEPDWQFYQPCPDTDEREERGGPHDDAGTYFFRITPDQYIRGGVFEGNDHSNNTHSCKFRDNPPSNLPYRAWIHMEPAKASYSGPPD